MTTIEEIESDGITYMLKRLVERILSESVKDACTGGDDFASWGWTLQGLGMLRLYLGADKQVRLHVWDDRYIADPAPSELHDHPWHLYSKIVAGEVRNTRFKAAIPAYEIHDEKVYIHDEGNVLYMSQTIFCGTGGGLCGVPEPVVLRASPEERYGEGAVYKQRADEIHKSNPLRGTVTLVERVVPTDDADHAHVFWPEGGEWITAEPRPATTSEVFDICSTSLALWF